MRRPLRFWSLLVDRHLDEAAVDDFLRRLAQPGAPRPLVLETWSDSGGVRWAVGTSPGRVAEVRSLARHVLGEVRLSRVSEGSRPRLDRARRIVLAPGALPLDPRRTAGMTQAVYEALARVRGSEVLVLQVVLGRGWIPTTASTSQSPTASLVARLRGTYRPLSSGERTRMHRQAEEFGLTLSVRLGVRADHPVRQRALLATLRDALRLSSAPAARVGWRRESAARILTAEPTGLCTVRLSTRETLPFIGLPLGAIDLPRLPLHPRRVIPPRRIESGSLVFARAAVGGYERSIGITPDALLSHTVVTGPTGSGKSTVLASIAARWITGDRPVALLDPKHQLIDQLLARLPKSAAGRVVVLDPTAERVPGFNPLDTGERNSDAAIDGVLSSLRVIFEDGWGPRTEDLLLVGLRSLALAGRRRGVPFTLIDLARLFMDPALRRSVVGAVQSDPALAAFWAGFDALSEAARADQVAAPLNKLRRFVLRPQMVAVLGQAQPRFRVRDLFQGDRALLVPLNEALIGPGSAQLLGSLLVAELFTAAQERALEDEPRQRPGLVIVDEAQRFIHLPTALEDALATSRSYGVGWILAHQYRAQLPRLLQSAVDANARSKIVFRSGVADARAYARMTRFLTAEDFMALDPYEAYLSLMQEDGSTPWFAARTLPPTPELGFEEAIRARSLADFGAEATPTLPHDLPPPDLRYRKPRTQ